MAADVCSATRLICFNLWIALGIFYLVFYMFASVLSGAFKLKTFDGMIPFNFEKCCAGDNENLVNMLSLTLTFMMCTGVYLIFIKQRIWDYALTVSLIHLGISCAVMQDFPVNWQWWIAYKAISQLWWR
ncbi:transmembrane protein 244 isoform X2 [Nematostella vectensis]|uniref:transmembrane protein 244 isoform X2 n=1 Tax=Nematostella vectensis TaxID=45351 RepID=UPI0013902713|nr:transmembrane protein 244 isoform X2 [Nematostella vectensis]